MTNTSIIFETSRLVIRRLEADDLMGLYAVCGDREVMKFVGNSEPLALDQVKEWLAITEVNYNTRGFGNYAIINKAGNTLIGYCGLVYSKQIEKIELIYALSKHHWYQGFATEAGKGMVNFGFMVIKLNEIYASIDPLNHSSQKILQKLGFSYVFEKEDEFGYPTHYYRISQVSS